MFTLWPNATCPAHSPHFTLKIHPAFEVKRKENRAPATASLTLTRFITPGVFFSPQKRRSVWFVQATVPAFLSCDKKKYQRLLNHVQVSSLWTAGIHHIKVSSLLIYSLMHSAGARETPRAWGGKRISSSLTLLNVFQCKTGNLLWYEFSVRTCQYPCKAPERSQKLWLKEHQKKIWILTII